MTQEQKKRMHDAAIEILRAVLTALLAILGATSLNSCGVTRASITNPQNGASTTITITTNNPITTNVTPDVQLNHK